MAFPIQESEAQKLASQTDPTGQEVIDNSPTTLSNANTIENVLPELNGRLQDFSQTGTYVDENGVTRYADGEQKPEKPPVEPQKETEPRIATGAGSQAGGQKGEWITNPNTGMVQFFPEGSEIKFDTKSVTTGTQADEANTEQVQADLMNKMKESLDAQTKRQISSIEQQFAIRKQQQAEINRRLGEARSQSLLMGGSSRYAQLSAEGVQSAQDTAGLLAIAQLDAEEKDLINKALNAQAQGNFQIMEKELELAETKRKEKQTAATKLSDQVAEQNKKLKENLIKSTRDSAVVDLFNQGLTSPSEILTVLNSNGGDFTFEEINKITKELTTPIKTPSGEYGEFLSLKADGEIPKDTNWFDYLAKKKKSEATPKDLSGVISGNAKKDAETIMSGVSPLKLSDLSTKDNYRANVASELNKRKEEALKSGDIVGVIRSSAGGKDVSDTFLQSFEKGINVITQIGDLQTAIDTEATGPIWGTIRGLNPYDVKAQTIKAQLAAIVPNLARGVYGEVGVLTDNDIKNYSKTLPTLQSTEEVRNAVLGITLRAVQRSLENKIKSQAGFGRDVSGIEGVYIEIKDLADKTLAPLEAKNTKNELDNLNLSEGIINAAPNDFWGNAPME